MPTTFRPSAIVCMLVLHQNSFALSLATQVRDSSASGVSGYGPSYGMSVVRPFLLLLIMRAQISLLQLVRFAHGSARSLQHPATSSEANEVSYVHDILHSSATSSSRSLFLSEHSVMSSARNALI